MIKHFLSFEKQISDLEGKIEESSKLVNWKVGLSN